jgi:ABC-type amino acid transport substrate-binding protein
MKRALIALALCVPLAAAHGPTARSPLSRKAARSGWAISQTSPPFSFDGEDGSPQVTRSTCAERVAEAIRQQLKLSSLKIQWVPLALQERIAAARSRKVDIECGARPGPCPASKRWTSA